MKDYNDLIIKFKSDGKFSVCFEDLEGKRKYLTDLDGIAESLISMIKESNDLRVTDKLISFTFKNINVSMIGYQFNTSNNFFDVINYAKTNYLLIKKERLKNRKITRKKILVSSLLLASLAATLLIGANIVEAKSDTGITNGEGQFVVEVVNEEDSSQNDIYAIEYEENIKNSRSSDNTICTSFNANYIDSISLEKYNYTVSTYGGLIRKIAPEYGVDPRIMIAIATQESGNHYDTSNPAAVGLMQIELSVWDNENITAFNYQKKEYETLHITKDKLMDVEFNIRVACMHYQNCLDNSNGIIEVATQMYNYGVGNIRKVCRSYYGNQELSLDSMLEGNYDDGWKSCRSNFTFGDPLYTDKIGSYLSIDGGSDLVCLTSDNSICRTSVNLSEKIEKTK